MGLPKFIHADEVVWPLSRLARAYARSLWRFEMCMEYEEAPLPDFSAFAASYCGLRNDICIELTFLAWVREHYGSGPWEKHIPLRLHHGL